MTIIFGLGLAAARAIDDVPQRAEVEDRAGEALGRA
jgi:hypothetical protein